jgi:hypothetical protein
MPPVPAASEITASSSTATAKTTELSLNTSASMISDSTAAVSRRDSGNAAEFGALSDVEEGSDEDTEPEGETHEERVAAMMAKYRRRSRMRRDSLPAALKGLSPIDDAEIGRLMHQEQIAREAAAAKAGQPQLKPPSVPASTALSAATTVSTSASTTASTSAAIQEQYLRQQAASLPDKPVAVEVAAVLNKASSDLIEELIAQGYSRENALELAKEIELDRRGERFHPRHAAAYVEGSPMPRSSAHAHGHSRSAASVTSNASSTHGFGHGGHMERSSFDRDRSFNDDDVGSMISNISGVSRASSYCESDKLLMNLLLSQQKGKYGVNMYEALTNQDEPAIERYMSMGSTLDQAVLKVFEKKYGSVDNQVLVSTSHLFVPVPCVAV